MDDGRIVSPSALCIDLNSHLSDLALAPPDYLPASLHEVLNAAGSSSISELEPPTLHIKGEAVLQNIGALVQNICLSSDLSDVILVHQSNSDGKLRNREKKTHHAHKLVLALASPAFRKMFSGGFAESMEVMAVSVGIASDPKSRQKINTAPSVMNNHRTAVALPAWADPTAVEIMLKYMYGDSNPLHLTYPSEDTIAAVCSLLRLSDFYELEHLKSLAEVWLASNDIVDVFNVVGLLTHAFNCRAKQLTKFAVYCCREMYSVVSETDEWSDLDEGLKRRVMDLT